ncbi:nitrilase/cyanide hydratase and apolipoprotein N-acyltransferase [Salinisphaera dokdonensis CL-ES53]|uniref:Nitrilase/cyanide hydratase and apolipoprotein N-acyltransferase n=1 Tax=Salinisphaera dokdonensis CL-ES53 TaxID=1304272 RepID=A0ABV2B2W2_9GAMM
MQSNISVAVVQHQPGDMDQIEANLQYIEQTITDEGENGNELVVFPEMGITSFFRHEPGGYERYWRYATVKLDGPELARVISATKAAQLYAIVGFAERAEITGVIYNSAALIGPDGILGVTRKVHLPGLEKLYYTPSDSISVIETPLGRIGIAICYDVMFPEYFRALSDQDADIIVFCSSTWKGGAKGGVGIEHVKRDYWSALPLVTAIQNQAFVVACNACGHLDMGSQAGTWERLGLSQVVAPTGVVKATAGDSDAETIRAVLDAEDLITARTSYRFLTDRLL